MGGQDQETTAIMQHTGLDAVMLHILTFRLFLLKKSATGSTHRIMAKGSFVIATTKPYLVDAARVDFTIVVTEYLCTESNVARSQQKKLMLDFKSFKILSLFILEIV